MLMLSIVGAVLCGLTGCQTMRSFRNASASKVTSARNWARNGFEALHEGHFSQAKTYFSRAARDLPDDHRIVANLARTEFEQGNIKQALATMEQAVKRGGDVDLRVELGQMYLKSGRGDVANSHVEIALATDPHSAAAWRLKGDLATVNNDPKNALLHYQRSLGYDKTSQEVQMLIAETYMTLGQPMRALSATETVLSQHPPDLQPEPAIIVKSQALVAMNLNSPAIDLLQIASQRANCSREIFYHLTETQLQSGQLVAAEQTIARAQSLFPEDAVLNQLAGAVQSASPASGLGHPTDRVAALKQPSPTNRIEDSRLAR